MHRPREERGKHRGALRQLPVAEAGAQALLNAPDITTTQRLRARAIVAPYCLAERYAGAKGRRLTDGRSSGGLTPEATVAALHANTPHLSV